MYFPVTPIYPPAPPVFLHPRLTEQQEIKFVSQRLGLGLLIMHGISGIFSVGIAVMMLLQMSGLPFLINIFTDSVALLNLNVIITVPMFLISFILSAKMLRVPVGGLIPLGKVPAELCAALVAVSLACAMVGNVFSDYMANILSQVGLESPSPDLGSSDGSLLSTVIMALTVAAVPALIEEFAFRGIFMGALRRFGDMFAIVMSSVFFGLMHGNLAQAPFAFIVGLALGYSVKVSGSLWPAIIAHFLNNLISVALDGVAGQLGYTAANLIFAGYMVAVIIIGLIAAARLFRRREISLHSETQTVLYTSEKVRAFLSAPAMIIAIIFFVLNIILAMASGLVNDILTDMVNS